MALKEFYTTYYAEKNMVVLSEELKEELEIWRKFREHILGDSLYAEEFNAANEYYKKNKEKDYSKHQNNSFDYSLRQFAEHESDRAGYLGQMRSGLFPLWIEKDTHTWNIRKPNENSKKSSNIEDAKKYFNDTIRPYLKSLLEQKSLSKVYSFINNNSLSQLFPPNFLVKLIVLNSLSESDDFEYHYKLLGIYKYNNIEALEEFSELKDCEIDGKNNDEEKQNPAVIALKKSEKAAEVFTKETGASINDEKSYLRAQECVWYLGNPDYSAIYNDLNVIFYGAPGTGKNFAVKKALHNIPEDQKLFVQFHPGFSYEDFIEGIKPTGIDKNGNLTFEIVNGVFKDFCIKANAKENRHKEYYFVADEINRANLSAVFGETLSLLERDYRYDPGVSKETENDRKACLRATPLSNAISKVIHNNPELAEKLAFYYNENTEEVLFGVPKNVHFIGMMNDVDKSIDAFDLALRRRFVWIRKDFDDKALTEIILNLNKDKESRIKYKELEKYIIACQRLNSYISGCEQPRSGIIKPELSLNLGKSFEFGHAFYGVQVSGRGTISQEAKADIFDNRLAPTLKEYCRSFFNETEIDSKIEEAKKVFCNVDSSGE